MRAMSIILRRIWWAVDKIVTWSYCLWISDEVKN